MAVAFDPAIANYLSQASDLTKSVFSKVASESAISGWALSKMLDKSPTDVEAALAELRQKELLEADGQGLEAIYHLTQFGYLARSMFQQM